MVEKQVLARAQEQKKQTEIQGNLNRTFQGLSIRAVEGEERTFELSFSSEEPYSRWWGVEVLDHTPGCVDLERINSIGCLLYNHNRDKVLGKVLKAWNDGTRCSAKVQFDDDAEADVIYKKVENKTLKGVSVGYVVGSWEEVAPNSKSADGRFTGPCDIAKRWEPYEISIVSVPADPTVGVGRHLEDKHTDNRRMLDVYIRQLQINKNKY
jgi:HK97 family phage prohead protease